MGGYLWRGSPELAELNAAILARRSHPDLPAYGNTGARAEAPCGTPAAFRRHCRAHEPACQPCLNAERLRRQLRKEAKRREVA